MQSQDIIRNDDGVSALSGLVLLKLFIPPTYYGAFMVFLPGGEPVGVISSAAAEILYRANGAPVSSLLDNTTGNNPHQVDRVIELLDAGLLVEGNKDSNLHWICPDNALGTRHSGIGAELFIKYYYDYFGSVFYDGSLLIDSHGHFLETISKYFPRHKDIISLDAGCGSGYYSAVLARLGHHVYVCDVSKKRLEAAESQPHGPGIIEAIECNLEDIPLADCSIDFAMCNFVLEHVADPFAVTEELVRLLQPGGSILLSMPGLNVRDTLAAWFHGEMPTLNFEHLRSYGLIPGTHPWCAPILDTMKHLNEKGISIEVVEGTNILTGLWEPWSTSLNIIAQQLGYAFPFTWPWNCLGRQIFIYGRKR